MTQVVFIVDGEERSTELGAGDRLLKAIYRLGLDEKWGMGECGGNCVCSTCHVYVKEGDFTPASEEEEQVLDTVFTATSASRLACQLQVTADHERVVVEVPAH